ncbi:hypothetical protein Rleg2_4765 (plasmid) [Rhizobium leguminosarum bv. trifolii WSM2304]|uniref:SpoVT-AbrB domain-containing protein n=1 Tax=Rhizobium leguminosarum bv. trifolii (strain WSM2304) TaxID=395492 RepID=A0ABF7QV87_RHILW|nr:hypothetical protein Rleg2_4765 [Rhizobium leguminosarum bv. trifolii WSM2304]
MYIKKEGTMHRTKVFKNGNSQAVRIPADLAYSQTEMDLEIERIGDELRIRLLKPSLEGILSRFARFDRSCAGLFRLRRVADRELVVVLSVKARPMNSWGFGQAGSVHWL